MSKLNAASKRIFGGKPDNDGYTAPPHTATQDDHETIAAGTTVRRVFPGPKTGTWSYHVDVVAGGATSALKFYFSNLPNPDPANAAHWKDSGIAAINLAVTGVTFATRTGDLPEWVMAEASAVTSPVNLFAYVKLGGDA